MTAADMARMIEQAFNDGNMAHQMNYAIESAPTDKLLRHWWTRGFAYSARLQRALVAEGKVQP